MRCIQVQRALHPSLPAAGMSLSSSRLGQCIFCQFRIETHRPRRIASSQRPTSFSTCSPLARGTTNRSANKTRNGSPFDSWKREGQGRSGLKRLGSRDILHSRTIRGVRDQDGIYRDAIYNTGSGPSEASRHDVSSSNLSQTPHVSDISSLPFSVRIALEVSDVGSEISRQEDTRAQEFSSHVWITRGGHRCRHVRLLRLHSEDIK